jgi:SAM-dependent methyltransferase
MFEHVPQREKNVLASTTFKRIADTFDLKSKRVLDLGCSYGEFMQRFGSNSVGITTTPEEVTYGEQVGRDIRLGNVEFLADTLPTTERFDVIWCNNILEHLLSPHSFFVHLKQYSTPETILILGTPMVPTPLLLTKFRPFRGSLATPHINFFTRHTYRFTAQFAGWDVKQIRPFLNSIHSIDTLANPFVPHLYMVAKNNAAYTYPPKKMHEWEHAPAYSELIKIMNTK